MDLKWVRSERDGLEKSLVDEGAELRSAKERSRIGQMSSELLDGAVYEPVRGPGNMGATKGSPKSSSQL